MNDTEEKWCQRKEQFFYLWLNNLLDDKNTPDIQSIWDMLTAHYSEPGRYYHTRQHILECLSQLDKVKTNLKSSDSVEMSIWFHDVIYDTRAKDNEEQSAKFFSQVAHEILPDSFIQTVSDLIIATKHLTAPPNCDQAYLLDIDLSSFGEKWVRFYLDGDNLRKEATHLSLEEYNDNKIIFFQMLLNRKQIFFTEYFHQKYEIIARRNIKQMMVILLSTD